MTPYAAIPLGYYAVVDPGDPTTMTYWRRASPRGREVFESWPTGTKLGPALYSRDVPAALRGEDRRAWIRAWYADVRHPWQAAVVEAIVADPVGTSVRFAEHFTRCCRCGRSLTEEASKAYGIGPECRRGMTPAELDPYVRAVGAAHAASLAIGGDV